MIAMQRSDDAALTGGLEQMRSAASRHALPVQQQPAPRQVPGVEQDLVGNVREPHGTH
jgi:hypothetical protein